jgi:hypothetical protein
LERFLAAQVKAVILHKMIRKLGFKPYIRRFLMSEGCIVPPKTEESVFRVLGDIQILDQMAVFLSKDQPHQAYRMCEPLMQKLINFHDRQIEHGSLESIRESGLLSGGGIQIRMFTRLPPKKK